MRRDFSRFCLFAAASSCALVACSQKTSGTIQLIAGPDGDPLRVAPLPTTLDVTAIDLAGQETSLAHADVGATTIDLGDHDTSTIAALRVTASDAAGSVLVWGRSLAVQLGALDATTLTLFVQRTGALAQMPSPLGDAREAPLLATAGGRYVLEAGGSDPALAARTQIYDLLTWSALPSPPVLPRAPKSLVVIGLAALAIDEAGGDWFDLSGASAATSATAPAGGSFAEVAGGATIVAPDGSAYVVGATRASGDATPRILHVSTSGELSFLALATPRVGAAAAWGLGRGLVVAGGSASGSGVELLAPGAAAKAIPSPADPIAGAGMASTATGHVVLVGGVVGGASAPTRELDLDCAASCSVTAWASVPPAPLAYAQAFALDATTLFVTGDDAKGGAHASTITASSAADVPLKLARNHARAIAMPNGAIAVVGGGATIESFVR